MSFARAFKLAPVIAVVVLAAARVDAQDDSETQAKIESAMSAAPTSVAQDAIVLDRAFDADGKFVVLREDTNGWSYLPDNPNTTVNDPACFDEVFMEWVYARIAGEEPNIVVPGFSYLLQGGEALSNGDPTVTESAEDHWMTGSPYMMVVLPSNVDLSGISSDSSSANPFVMYAGTPYQHLMVQVGNAEQEQ